MNRILLLAALLAAPLTAIGDSSPVDGVYECATAAPSGVSGSSYLVAITDAFSGQIRWGFIAASPVTPYYGYGVGRYDTITSVYSGQTSSGLPFYLSSNNATLTGTIDLVQKGVPVHLQVNCWML